MCIGKRGSFTKMKFRWRKKHTPKQMKLERKAFVIKWTIFRFLAGNNVCVKRERKTFFKLRWNTKKAAPYLCCGFPKPRPDVIPSIILSFRSQWKYHSNPFSFSLSFIHSLYCVFCVLINKETNEQKMELRKNHNWNYRNELRGWVMKVEYFETNE